MNLSNCCTNLVGAEPDIVLKQTLDYFATNCVLDRCSTSAVKQWLSTADEYKEIFATPSVV